MKALSLTPWWAWIVAQGLKPVENRKWPTSFRGEVLIHASLGKKGDFYEVLHFLQERPALKKLVDAKGGLRFEVSRGGIVAKARIVDCVEVHDSPWFFGPYGFVLEDVKMVSFVPCKGMLGFWQVPNDVLAALEAA